MVNGQVILTVLMGAFLLAVAAGLTRLESWGSYTPAGGGGVGDETAHGHREKPGGILRWLTTVDHKDIGMLYGTYAVIAFAWGGIAVMLMRLELSLPGETIIGASTYNALLTSHGITMLFLFGTPVIAAFANYFIPILIDADDMAFPRINAIAFWLLPPAALLVWGGFFLAPFMDAVAGAQTSWTMYPPLSTSSTAMGTPAGPNGVINAGADM